MNFLDRVPEIMQDALETFKQRNAVYGKSAEIHGLVMKALFPEGLKLNTQEDFQRFSHLNFIVGKLVRYTQNFNEGGHIDSIHDIGVYAFMNEALDRAQKLDGLFED